MSFWPWFPAFELDQEIAHRVRDDLRGGRVNEEMRADNVRNASLHVFVPGHPRRLDQFSQIGRSRLRLRAGARNGEEEQRKQESPNECHEFPRKSRMYDSDPANLAHQRGGRKAQSQARATGAHSRLRKTW